MGLRLLICEESDTVWSCTVGDLECDEHSSLVDAILHLQCEAPYLDEPELVVRFADGTEETLGTVPFLFDA